MRILSLCLLLALGVSALTTATAVTLITGDDSGNLTITGTLTADTVVSSNEYTLTNGETLDNASDAIVRVTFDDDAPTLGQFKLESDNDQLLMANGDSILISAIAEDSAGVKLTWGEVDFEVADTNTASPDGLLKLKTLVNGVLTTKLSIDSGGVLLESGERIDNSVNEDLDFVFDDDNGLLGEVRIRTGIAAGSLEDGNYFELHFTAPDSGGTKTDYATIRGTLAAKTTPNERGTLKIYTNEDGTPTLRGTWDLNGLTVAELINTATLTASGDITANGNIVGDDATIITNVLSAEIGTLNATNVRDRVSGGAIVTVTNLQTKSVVVDIAGFNATEQEYLWIAPYACTIIDGFLVSDTTTTVSDGSSNYTFNVQNLTAANSLNATSPITSTTEMTADTAYTLALDQNLTLAKNAVIELQITKAGTPTDLSAAQLIAVLNYR